MAGPDKRKAEPKLSKKQVDVPLVYMDMPAETSIMLANSRIAYEPRGSAAYEILLALARGKRDSAVSRLVKKIEPWQKKRIEEIINEYGRRREILLMTMDKMREKNMEKDSDKLPISVITMTEKCNRGCPHCGVLSDMSLLTMPFSDFERYLGLIRIKSKVAFSGAGEQFMYISQGKNLGDVVARTIERFQSITVDIVTSGISFSDKGSIEIKAAERLARMNDMDKLKIWIKVSIRSFMKKRMEDAKRTLKFFIDTNIKVTPHFEGITFIRDKDGKWSKNEYERMKIFSDVVDCFGIRKEDACRIHNPIRYSERLCHMGRLAKSNLTKDINDYYGKQEGMDRHLAVVDWDGRRGICKEESFGLGPDGSIMPGCCHLVSVFLKLGSLNGANSDNIADVAKEMKENAKQMCRNIERSKKKDSCKPCVSWFRRMNRKNNGIGIRDEERLGRAIPTLEDIRRLNRKKVRVPAKIAG